NSARLLPVLLRNFKKSCFALGILHLFCERITGYFVYCNHVASPPVETPCASPSLASCFLRPISVPSRRRASSSSTRLGCIFSQLSPVISAASRSRVDNSSWMRTLAALASISGLSCPCDGPYHSAPDHGARTAGSLKKPGALIRPLATASASHSS